MENREVISDVSQREDDDYYHYKKLVQERVEDGKKIKIEIYKGMAWNYIRETVNNNFRRASFIVNDEVIKLKVPSKKRVAQELKRLLDIDINLK